MVLALRHSIKVANYKEESMSENMNEKIRVENVSDTALWVATYRARESRRADALFKDSLAEKLVGERGQKIANLLGYSEVMYWVMVVRTVAIDRLILKALNLGVDTIVNLGTGLDTRPYRMKLPKNLRWVEVDFANIIEFKNEKLASEEPVCNIERIAVDLSQTDLRRELFEKIGSESKKALIITEGVIPYLSNEAAANLAKDVFAIPSFQYWIQDFRNGGLKKHTPRSFKKHLKEAPFLFEAKNWLGFFEELGWTVNEVISALDEGVSLNRPFPMPFPWSFLFKIFPKKIKDKALAEIRNDNGSVLFEKTQP